ncbi:MAG: hypothetical protein AB7O39_03235 [Flavobacteriaceae bacterium]
MSFYPSLKSIVGRRIGLASTGNLVASPNGSDIAITPPCVDASITVGAENANVRPITIQLKDANGDDIAYAELVKLYVFTNATRQALGTGGSTGIAIGTDGTILITHTAKLIFELISEADGDIDLTWTDTGTESVVLGLLLPNGRWVMSDAIANT